MLCVCVCVGKMDVHTSSHMHLSDNTHNTDFVSKYIYVLNSGSKVYSHMPVCSFLNTWTFQRYLHTTQMSIRFCDTLVVM